MPGSPAKPIRYDEMISRPGVYPSDRERRVLERKSRKMVQARAAAEEYRHNRPGGESISTKGSAALVAPKYGPPSLPAGKPPVDPTKKIYQKVSERAHRRMLDTGHDFRAVSLAPPPHAPVPETSIRILKRSNDAEGGHCMEARLSNYTRSIGAQPVRPGGAPSRVIKENCRDNNSVGAAPVVYSPGPGGYRPVYPAPNKEKIGVTAAKIAKQMSTRAGRLRAEASDVKHQDFGASPRMPARGPTKTPGWMESSSLRVAPWSQWRGSGAATVPAPRRAAPDLVLFDLKMVR